MTSESTLKLRSAASTATPSAGHSAAPLPVLLRLPDLGQFPSASASINPGSMLHVIHDTDADEETPAEVACDTPPAAGGDWRAWCGDMASRHGRRVMVAAIESARYVRRQRLHWLGIAAAVLVVCGLGAYGAGLFSSSSPANRDPLGALAESPVEVILQSETPATPDGAIAVSPTSPTGGGEAPPAAVAEPWPRSDAGPPSGISPISTADAEPGTSRSGMPRRPGVARFTGNIIDRDTAPVEARHEPYRPSLH